LISKKETKMANMSSTTAAIESIAQHLARACEAARGLDAMMSQDLQSLLRIAGCEADRVRKAGRKAARSKAQKAMQTKKQPAQKKQVVQKRVRAAAVAKGALHNQGRGRRRAATMNGIAH
jgi:hypothetical protein